MHSSASAHAHARARTYTRTHTYTHKQVWSISLRDAVLEADESNPRQLKISAPQGQFFLGMCSEVPQVHRAHVAESQAK
eukprot:1159338-Pelagomonas_calceolata.AAC.5